MKKTSTSPSLSTFHRPYHWADIDTAVQTTGGAILAQFLTDQERWSINDQIDDYLQTHDGAGRPHTGSESYNSFLGHQTVRLHGLIDKAPRTAELIGHADLIGWANRHIGPQAGSVMLNAAELIQVQPDEPKQLAHRDSDSWPEAQLGNHPIVVNAIIALDPFTLANGATYLACNSWQWDRSRRAKAHEYTRAIMAAGDALLFRGDLIHRGGENSSLNPRRAISVSYCAGWLRPVENSFLNLGTTTVARLSTDLQAVLGYQRHDTADNPGGLLGLYENGDPANALPHPMSVIRGDEQPIT